MKKKSNFKIWTEECKTTGKDDDLYLRLDVLNHDVYLCACDKNGNTIDYGYILSYLPDIKTIVFHNGLNDRIDILKDFKGKALISDQKEVEMFFIEKSSRESSGEFFKLMEKEVMKESTSSTIN